MIYLNVLFVLPFLSSPLLEQGKRPYHTIIPCMVTTEDSGELFATMTNMVRFWTDCTAAVLGHVLHVFFFLYEHDYMREVVNRTYGMCCSVLFV